MIRVEVTTDLAIEVEGICDLAIKHGGQQQVIQVKMDEINRLIAGILQAKAKALTAARSKV